MRPQSLVSRLLAVSLFTASCLGTLALFGCVPMLPRLTARIAGIRPDLSEFASSAFASSEFASNDALPQRVNHLGRAWIAELPSEVHPRSVELLRYRVPR